MATTETTPTLKRVAIIGGGASGTSAAYFIRKGMKDADMEVDITLYEKNDSLGGRVYSMAMPAPLDKIKVDLGASIFVEENPYVKGLAREFGIGIKRTKDLLGTKGKDRSGIWDGEKFLFRSWGNFITDPVRAFLRYGILTPRQVGRYVKSILKKYQSFYKLEKPFTNLGTTLTNLGFDNDVSTTAQDTLDNMNVTTPEYLKEIVEISTRVNYAQSLVELHSVGMSISMIPISSKEYALEGGNQQLYEKLAEQSGATVHLNTAIASLWKEEGSGQSPIYKVGFADNTNSTFDAVVVAHPLGIDKDNALQIHMLDKVENGELKLQLPVEYQTLHVTLVIGQVSAGYFGLGESHEQLPESIFPVKDATDETPFNSLSVLRVLSDEDAQRYCKENKCAKKDDKRSITITKIFSHQEMSDDSLGKLFSARFWTFRHTWKAYPKLVSRSPTDFPPVVLDKGVFYPNSFEPFISTMETSMVSSANVARLVIESLTGKGVAHTGSDPIFLERKSKWWWPW
ncbi:hypothetical protein IWQ61_000469 [Dispira simplex]|nr:hypothetical protein IWQ61_000469 [Dispira simplex]